MKKLISLSLICVLLVSCFAFNASAETGEKKFPFELIPAKNVSIDKVYEDDSTDVDFLFSMEEDMQGFLQDLEDPDKKEKILKDFGLDDIWISAQIDWAIDDKTDWHHNEFWDDNEATRLFGFGYDKDANLRVSEWDAVDIGVSPQTVNDSWITRFAGDPSDPDDARWYGRTYENGTRCPGMKDLLKEGQYEIVEDGTRVRIDYTKHTLYARMRYLLAYRTPVFDEWGNQTSNEISYRFSDWSDAAAYGADAPKWKPPYTADNIEAPDISDLYETGELFNGYPVVGYNLKVSDEMTKNLVEITSKGGYIHIETEARVKGNDVWNALQGDFTVVSGKLFSDILAINGDGNAIPKGTELEFRARFYCEERLDRNGDVVDCFYSPYSKVLNVTLSREYKIKQAKPSPEVPSPTVVEPVIKDLEKSSTKTQVDKFIKSLKTDSDPKGTTFGLLSARQKKVAKNAITISWNKLKGAKSYVIYGNKCGKKNRYQYLTAVSGTSWTQKKLKSGTYYKYLVTAFDKNGKSIATAKTLHIATSGGKAGNFGKVTTAAKKDKVTLAKKGKTFKLKAKAKAQSKKQKVNVHRPIQYESSNPKVAAVSSKGVITAKKKGSCVVYAYAQSGAFKKIKVTVKK